MKGVEKLAIHALSYLCYFLCNAEYNKKKISLFLSLTMNNRADHSITSITIIIIIIISVFSKPIQFTFINENVRRENKKDVCIYKLVGLTVNFGVGLVEVASGVEVDLTFSW